MTLADLLVAGATTGDVKHFVANDRMAFDKAPELGSWKPRPRQRPPKENVTIRACLCCGRDFESEGIHNRLCYRCRSLA